PVIAPRTPDLHLSDRSASAHVAPPVLHRTNYFPKTFPPGRICRPVIRAKSNGTKRGLRPEATGPRTEIAIGPQASSLKPLASSPLISLMLSEKRGRQLGDEDRCIERSYE